MVMAIIGAIKRRGTADLRGAYGWLLQRTKPATRTWARGAIADVTRSKAALSWAHQVRYMLRAYRASVTTARTHPGSGQTLAPGEQSNQPRSTTAAIVSMPILDGLRHDDQRVA